MVNKRMIEDTDSVWGISIIAYYDKQVPLKSYYYATFAESKWLVALNIEWYDFFFYKGTVLMYSD